MHSHPGKPVYYFQAEANTFGGFLQTPEPKTIPAQASVSLPPVGGYAAAQTGAFNLDQIVSVKSTYARVAGRKVDDNGGVSTLVTSVIEGLNILEVVTAERIVAQLTVEAPALEVKDGRRVMPRRRISLAGSRFEGLRIGGIDAAPTFNQTLLRLRCKEKLDDAPLPPNTWYTCQQVGIEQAKRLVRGSDDTRYDGMAWLRNRYDWMESPDQGLTLCSLVDEIDSCVPGTCLGHVVDIPDFGRIFLGELLVSPLSVQLTMIRAELGCTVNGGLGGAHVNSNGTTVPPGKPE